jgi:polar amino acid transport system substrate-binding protein
MSIGSSWAKCRTVIALTVTIGLLCAGCGDSDDGASEAKGKQNGSHSFGTAKPGVIQLSIESYMPYSGTTASGELTGLDGDIIKAAAEELGLEIEFSVTDFAGTLAAVQSGRADMTIGSVGWTEERERTGLFTDPPYYSPAAVIEREGDNFSTVSEMEDRALAGQAGSLYLPGIKAIPGVTLRTFPTADAALTDVASGRVDGFFADPLIAAFAAQSHAKLKLHAVYITPPTEAELEAHPDFETLKPYQTAFYVAKRAKKLEEALSKVIRSYYASGKLEQLIKKWGGDPEEFLTPTDEFTEQRIGVDRPKGWKAPTID